MKKMIFLILLLSSMGIYGQNMRVRDYGIEIGVLKTGDLNAIQLVMSIPTYVART